MKNLIYLLIFLSTSTMSFSQVGIGTNNPKTTLQIDAEISDVSFADGVTLPTLTRGQLSSKNVYYGTDHNGTLVFVTTLDGVAINKVTNVNTIGFYFYDAPNAM